MRRPLSLLAAALLAAAPVAQAVFFKDQVDQIDFHYPLVGLPQEQNTFFHRPRPDDRASLLYTLSDAGVLGAVNPGTGGLVWRQLLATETKETKETKEPREAGQLVAVDGEDWLAAGLGSSVHAWHAASGRAIWWQDFAGELIGLDVATTTTTTNAKTHGDVLALFREEDASGAASTAVLRRLDGANGHVLWEHRETASAQHQTLQVRALGADKAVVVRAGGAAGVQAVVLDLQTGKRLEEHALAGKAGSADRHDVLFIGGGGPAAPAIVAWTDSARAKIHVSVLDPKPQTFSFALPADTAEVLVHAPRNLPASPSLPLHFVVHTRTAVDAAGKQQHRAQVFHVDPKTKAITKAYDLPQAPGAGAFAASVSAAGDAIFFTRIADDEMVLIESESHGILGRWPVTAATTGMAGSPALHAAGAAAAEVVAKPGGDGFAVRAAVVTEDEDWVLVRNGLLAWSRPEGLTGAVAAAFAEHAESEQLVRALEQEAHSNPLAAYAHRVKRHFADLEHLPAYLESVSQRLVNSILGGDGATTTTAESDPFGFHKLAILATKRGRLYGLDAASPGRIRWSRKAVTLAPGTTWAVQRIHVDEAQGVATVFGQTARQSVTVQVETGETETFSSPFPLTEEDAEIVSTALVTSAAGPWVLPIPKQRALLGNIPVAQCPRETVVVRADEALEGVRFIVQEGRCAPEVTWTFVPPRGSRMVHVAVRPAHDPVASIGRVLGDRRVLYKYLNPHVAVVSAVDDGAATLTTVLLDTVSGVVLAASTYAGVDGTKPVECVLVENSFLCSFFADYVLSGDGRAPAAIKGHHLTVSDLYASLTPNERGLGSLGSPDSNVSSLQPLEELATSGESAVSPAVVTQTWVVAAALRALAVTQTRQGITVRQVLTYLPGTHGILGLPRVAAVLDARRPVGRDPTPQELEEGLTRYTPNLEIDPRMVVTHERDVVGIEAIVTAPTHVESTSLVLAFGAVDVFGTRLAPSMAFDLLDKGFNKASMLATVLALAVGVAVLRPMVAKKQINMRWQAPS